MSTDTDFIPDEIDRDLLPESYDQLIPSDQLILGEHNPREVTPTSSLQRSINQHGIALPLIVRPDQEDDIYHITDGWQRYQAATACGWEVLPVKMYDTALAALEATETASIVRERSPYEWARYCQSLADELGDDATSRQDLIEQIAKRTIKSPATVRRYLDALSLPTEVHPLLNNGPEGTPQQWAALRNHNQNVRYYGDLWWSVAARLGRKQDRICDERILGIAATAVEFDTSDDAMEFVDKSVSQPGKAIGEIKRRVLLGRRYDQYLEVPRVAIRLTSEEKQAVMDYCYETNQSLSDIVEQEIGSLVDRARGDY